MVLDHAGVALGSSRVVLRGSCGSYSGGCDGCR